MPPSNFPLPDLAATFALAEKIVPLLRQGDVVALKGELGTGKTEFARALLRVLGITGDVPSPTFTLLQTYETENFLVSHFDLYRLKSADELDELGWEDALSDGITFIEWPERAGTRIPADRLELTFRLNADGVRNVSLNPLGQWLSRL